MLTKPQQIGLIVAVAVAAVVLLPAGLIAFWHRRVRREAAEEERYRLATLEALGLPVPDREEDLPSRGVGGRVGGEGKAKGKAGRNGSATSSVRPSWRMYLCRGRDLGEAEIMARSKTIAATPGPAPGCAPGDVGKGKGKGKALASPAV